MKNRLIAAGLAFFGGVFGLQKFYLGKTFQGILCVIFWVTLIPFFIGIVDTIQFLSMSDDDFDLKFNYGSEDNLLRKERLDLEREKLKIEKLRLQRQRLVAENDLKKEMPAKAITGEQADELAAWHDLLEKGIIDKFEYEEKRKIILGID
jgi:TM2 domain-containing membrane protein YozV